eukprot:5723742-Heterocapsa_arctica.AAC.1
MYPTATQSTAMGSLTQHWTAPAATQPPAMKGPNWPIWEHKPPREPFTITPHPTRTWMDAERIIRQAKMANQDGPYQQDQACRNLQPQFHSIRPTHRPGSSNGPGRDEPNFYTNRQLTTKHFRHRLE